MISYNLAILNYRPSIGFPWSVAAREPRKLPGWADSTATHSSHLGAKRLAFWEIRGPVVNLNLGQAVSSAVGAEVSTKSTQRLEPRQPHNQQQDPRLPPEEHHQSCIQYQMKTFGRMGRGCRCGSGGRRRSCSVGVRESRGRDSYTEPLSELSTKT